LETVGIPLAIDSRGTRHDRRAIDKKPRPFDAHLPLRCGACSAAVSSRRGHERRTGTGISNVRPHYFLKAHAEHDPGCPFDFRARADEIVREHRGTVERDGDQYELLLPDLDGEALSEPALPVSKESFTVRDIVPDSSRNTLISALNGAARIAALLRAYENDEEATGRFRVRHKGTVILWKDFCVDAQQDISAAVRRSLEHDYPLAVHGIVGVIGTRRGKSGREYFEIRVKREPGQGAHERPKGPPSGRSVMVPGRFPPGRVTAWPSMAGDQGLESLARHRITSRGEALGQPLVAVDDLARLN
jgi:hypothetical protein